MQSLRSWQILCSIQEATFWSRRTGRIKKHAAKDDQLLVQHHQSTASLILQNSRKKVPPEEVITKSQMTIQVGIEKTSELSICHLNDADLEMAIADFFIVKI